jgi:predicted HicB family RNase H-like nuclease
MANSDKKSEPHFAKRRESTVNDVMIQSEGFAGRCQKVLQVAKQLYLEKPDWVTFFRETLGVKGAARSVFPTQSEYVQFEQSNEFSEIQNMVAGLRTRKVSSNKNEPTRVITVRLPESLHEALKAEASDHNTSMNKLCISKLLQVLIENEKAAQAQKAANRATTIPMNPVPKPIQPSPAAQAVSPAQSPSFRSTYSPQTNHQGNHQGQPRYGQ